MGEEKVKGNKFSKLKHWAENIYLKGKNTIEPYTQKILIFFYIIGPGPLSLPSINELLIHAQKIGIECDKKEIQKFRDSLEVISRYKKIGLSGLRGRKIYRPSLVPRFGWVHLDIGFINLNKKEYGQFLIATDSLSRLTYIEARHKHAKNFKSIKTFIINLLQIQGFKHTYRLVSDDETSLSYKNIQIIETLFPHLRIIKLGYNLHTKAFHAERRIREFKSKLSRVLTARNLPISSWKKLVPEITQALNETSLVKNFKPSDIKKSNIHRYVTELINQKKKYAYSFLYGLDFPQRSDILDKLFKYNIGDKIYLRIKDNPDDKIRSKAKFAKPTIRGHFDKKLDPYKISNRTFSISSESYLTTVYQLINTKTGKTLKRLIEEDYIRPFPS